MNAASPQLDRAPKSGAHAIVVGGSMAGLVSARVLAEHFDHVTLIERDRYPERPEPRRGIPQSRHIHFVLARGREELERLFPALPADLRAAGAVKFDYARDTNIRSQHGRLNVFESRVEVCGCSRPLLDWLVCGYLKGNSKVTVREETTVLGLQVDPSKSRVEGVRLRSPAGEETLLGDLVVDVTGRQAASMSWLEALALPTPRERSVSSHLGYACREYERPSDSACPWMLISTIPQAPHWARSAALFAIEGNRWLAMLASIGDDRPTDDEAAFLAFAETLGHPKLYELLATATPRGPVLVSRTSRSELREWHAIKLPRGLVVLGDAVCALNPIYGHGITLATLGALALGSEIEQQRRRYGHLLGLSSAFQRRLFKIVRGPFWLVAGLDATWPGSKGADQLGLYGRFMCSRLGRKMVASSSEKMHRIAGDPEVMSVVLRIAHLVGAPWSLLRPRMLLRLLRQLAFRRLVKAPETA